MTSLQSVPSDQVTTTNLTRAEAAERSSVVQSNRYVVHLDLSSAGDHDTFLSTTTATFTATPGSSTWIDIIAPSLVSATLNGLAVDLSAFTGTRLPIHDLAEENTLVVVANCEYMRTGEGLHRFIDPVDKAVYLYTQFEIADARRVYACFDQPDLKAEFELTVLAPDYWHVVSNSPTPEPIKLELGLAEWSFEATPRIPTYITAICAGPYHVVSDEYSGPHGTYPMSIFCRQSLAEFLDQDDVFTVTKQGFEFFESQFGVPYPFKKYDQLFVPEFNAGAMENAGCVTILEDLIFRSRVTDMYYEARANTILHELAHMWFGDLVTMVWWDDLWLNESFAEWAAHWSNERATRYTDAWTTFLSQRKNWAYRQDQLPSTHPIAADMVDLETVEVNFDGITYAKGASALRQLVAWVGEDHFLAGINAYFTKNAWGNTRLVDLLAELEASSGRELKSWSDQWLETSGVNLLRAELELADDGTFSSVTVIQEPPSAPVGIEPVLRSHRIAIGLYSTQNGALERVGRVETDVVGERTSVPELVGVAQPDLLLLNDDDLTFAKIRLDERSLTTAVASLGTIRSTIARTLVWTAAWDMTRDAEISTGDYLALIEQNIGTESDIGVVQVLLSQVKLAIENYAAPEHRAAYRDRLAALTAGLLATAAPASDHQLAFARNFASAARTPEHAAVLREWLNGSAPEGLAIDTDLRWTLLQRLIALGAAVPEEIDLELERDDTATGRRQAATARAGIPTAAAKEAAWAEAVEGDELPNAMLSATVGGFNQPDQRELLVPFVTRYFEAIPRIWAERTNEIAQTITLGLYPALLASQQTIDATNAFLEREDVPSGARRLIGEGRDGIQRALRAQERDRRASDS